MPDKKRDQRWNTVLTEDEFIPLDEFTKLSARFQEEARRRNLTKLKLLRALKDVRKERP